MPDYKKTVKNLEALSNILAYDGDLQGMRTIDDALALLKEQEERIKFLEKWIAYLEGGDPYEGTGVLSHD